MLLFDCLSARVGVWTAVTAGTYGLLGWGFSALYRRLINRGCTIGPLVYLVSGVGGVLAFDFVTGPVMSSIAFGLTFGQAVIGQVPFTIWHLASVSAYALIVSPLVERALAWVMRLEPHLARVTDPRARAFSRRV
jgi:hypothetical protein